MLNHFPIYIQAGDFDLTGMLAALGAQAKTMGARRIVFDALDIVLALLPDQLAKRREVFRLHEWLLLHGLTGLITAKAGGDEDASLGKSPFSFMQFMVDCAVTLNHGVFARRIAAQPARSKVSGLEFRRKTRRRSSSAKKDSTLLQTGPPCSDLRK